jgi:hypothetical protein
MALFTLTDIAYKKLDSSGWINNPNNKSLNEYGPNLLRYPSDLGNTDKGHYMMIHVHAQDKTSYVRNLDRNNQESAIQRNREGLRAQTGATNLGGAGRMVIDKINDLFGQVAGTGRDIANTIVPESYSNAITEQLRKLPTESLSEFVAGAKESVGTLNNSNFLRTTKRTTDSIALYMPDTLAFTDEQTFSSLAMGGENAALAAAGVSILSDAASGDKFDARGLGKNASPFIGDFIANRLSPLLGENSTRAAMATLFGAVKNPQLELIYSSPEFRAFAFEFMFYPRSEKEAKEVQKIVQRLRFHQAPEILSGSAGYFMVPPSEFDIEFYYNGEVNPNIPKISTCALTSISIDYAPNGFRAYEVPGENSPKMGSTGMPVAMRVNLSFRELEIMTKFNYQDESNRLKTRKV